MVDTFEAATPQGYKTVEVLRRAGEWVAHKAVVHDGEWTIDKGFSVSHVPTGHRLVGCEFEETALALVEEAAITITGVVDRTRLTEEQQAATLAVYAKAEALDLAAWEVLKTSAGDTSVEAALAEYDDAEREVEELEDALSEARWRLVRAEQAHTEALAKLRESAGKSTGMQS